MSKLYYGLSIDPGMSNGACLFSWGDDQPYKPERLWQFPLGAAGLGMWADHVGLKMSKAVPYYGQRHLDALVVEKFTPWNNPTKEFKLTQDSVEPLRGEGVLIGRGFGNSIQWGQPGQQYFIGSPELPKEVKRKLSKEFLKKHGFYITGSQVAHNKDAEDAISAQLHAIAWLRRKRHMPTMTALFKED